MLKECTHTKHILSIWRKAKVIAIPKPGKDPSSPKSYRPISLLCIPYKLYERLIYTDAHIPPCRWEVDKRPSRRHTWSFMCRSAPQLDSAHRRRLRKKDVNRCSICRPVSCIRHSSTSTNDKKADGHDWRHRSMPGDTRPSQQSPLLCTAKWQEEPMEEPEERTAARKCLSPLTVQHLYKRLTSAYGLQQVHICWWPLYHHPTKWFSTCWTDTRVGSWWNVHLLLE